MITRSLATLSAWALLGSPVGQARARSLPGPGAWEVTGTVGGPRGPQSPSAVAPDDPGRGKPSPQLFQHWVHSREEDAGGVRVYRPADSKSPPARGREGFEFRQNGELVLYRPAPSDATKRILGRWKAEGPDKIVATFADKAVGDFTLLIESLNGDMLKVRTTGTDQPGP